MGRAHRWIHSKLELSPDVGVSWYGISTSSLDTSATNTDLIHEISIEQEFEKTTPQWEISSVVSNVEFEIAKIKHQFEIEIVEVATKITIGRQLGIFRRIGHLRGRFEIAKMFDRQSEKPAEESNETK